MNDARDWMSEEGRCVEHRLAVSRSSRFPKYLLPYLDAVDDAVRSSYVLEDGRCTLVTWTLLRRQREVGQIMIEFPEEFEAILGPLARKAEQLHARTVDGLFEDG
jgi:hypothetical protein